jgi:cell division protein FtsQ
VQVKERTPVAFVRQGTQIGLVDASGVLLDMATDASADAHYSFPVLTGIAAGDPLSTRAARMEIYERFLKDLDGSGKGFSRSVSEVDVTDPEDVKALVLPSTGAANSEVLVHFGDEHFLDRYNEFEKHLPEWKQQYPKLASADMRYDGQIVLEMRKDSGDVAAAATAIAPAPVDIANADLPKSAPVKAKLLSVAAKVKAPVKGKAPGKKAAVAKKTATKKVAAKKVAGQSAANEKMYAALSAQRKAAEAHLGGTR